MSRIRDALRASPQQVDPLSWAAGPLASIVFAVLVVSYGGLSVVWGWHMSERPWLDLGAVVILAGACVLVIQRSNPLRPALGPAAAVLPIVVAGFSIALSALSHMNSAVPVQFWWVPVGLALFLCTFFPASSGPHVLSYGLILTIATGVAALVAFGGRNDPWSDVGTVLVACATTASGTIAVSVFSYRVVFSSQRLLAGAGLPVDESLLTEEQTAREVEIAAIARLGSRVAPFLAAIAAAGTVTAEDRALAGQLARRLRNDLVSHADESWLDTIAHSGRILIVDPDHRANRMNAAQRSALRALLRGVIDEPSADARSLFVELRGQDDGSTAVAISLDLDLPEGRRIMMLAPYYVTLKATVPDISWDSSRDLLRFRVPPEQKG